MNNKLNITALPTLENTLVTIDENFCMLISDFYDNPPNLHHPEYVKKCYEKFKKETYHQFLELENYLSIIPWEKEGQPYTSYKQMEKEVLKTKKIYIFLTENGYGEKDLIYYHDHPLLEKTNIIINDRQLCYNDLFRAVHDLNGHILSGGNFSIKGEFLAAKYHLRMYSEYGKLAAFTETVAQICWFYYGKHLRKGNNMILSGDANYLQPHERPYSEQKAVIFSKKVLCQFENLIFHKQAS